MSLAVVFLSVVFSGLGLAMAHASGLHLRLNAFRKTSALLDCASENGLKRGFLELAGRLQEAGGPAALADGRLEEFLKDPEADFPLLLEETLGPVFPRSIQEAFENMTWECRAECGFGGLADLSGLVKIIGALRIEANGRLERVSARRSSALDGAIGLLAGRIPLAAIPLFIRKDMTAAEKAAFPGENGIRLLTRPGEPLGPGLAASAEGVLPADLSPLLGKALSIRLFSPEDLTPARLREVLGLEPSQEPVPDGVYLIRNDLGLGGIFVQGSLDEMVLAVRGDAQVIAFRVGDAEWVLEFSPARSRTVFRTPEGESSFDLVPLPIVLVNGEVVSFGGGVVENDGRVTMTFDGEAPSVLSGVDLTIVSAGKITISSHLTLQGVRWQDGVPYLKESQAQLVIYASARDLVSGEEVAGGIAVDAAAPSGLKLQGSLTAASGGFVVEGSGKEIQVAGAVHADAFSGNGNRISVLRDDRVAGGIFPADGPRTATPQLAVYSLKVLAWREY